MRFGRERDPEAEEAEERGSGTVLALALIGVLVSCVLAVAGLIFGWLPRCWKRKACGGHGSGLTA